MVVPADFLMSHDMLHGVKQRAEGLAYRRRSAVPGVVFGASAT
jgi:hypothetical protein